MTWTNLSQYDILSKHLAIGLSWAISCNLGLFWAISGYLWLYLAIFGYIWLSLWSIMYQGVQVEAEESNLLLFETFVLISFYLSGMSYRGAFVPKNNVVVLWPYFPDILAVKNPLFDVWYVEMILVSWNTIGHLLKWN